MRFCKHVLLAIVVLDGVGSGDGHSRLKHHQTTPQAARVAVAVNDQVNGKIELPAVLGSKR